MTVAGPDGHQRAARIRENRPGVGEVYVDLARYVDYFGHPHNALPTTSSVVRKASIISASWSTNSSSQPL